MPKSSLASETVRSCAWPFGSNSNVYRPSVFFAEIANAPLVLNYELYPISMQEFAGPGT